MTVLDDSTYLVPTVLALVASLAFYVWIALALAAVFRKSGEEGWQAWVPVLNIVVLLRLGGISPWLLLLVLFPILGLFAVWVLQIIACHRIGRAFGYGAGMTVLAVLLFPIWASVLGFGSARWVGHHTDAGPRRVGGADPAVADAPLPPARVEPAPAAYSPIAPPPAYGRAPQPPAYGASGLPPAPGIPSQPPVTAAPVSGWAPPPLPAPSAVAAAAAASEPAAPSLAGPSAAAPAAAAREDTTVIPPAPAGWEGFEFGDIDELTGEVTGAVSGAPEPIAAVPVIPSTPPETAPRPIAGRSTAVDAAGSDDIARSDAAASPPVTRVPAAVVVEPAAEPWAPARSPMSDPEAFPETSGPVSAIAGAPDAGAPRSARASVSALHTHPEIPDEIVDETIIARRRQTVWSLVPPSGDAVPLGADVVILGRRPVADPEYPGAQLVRIQDGTVSKTHARLRLRDDKWWVTDLGSTNGVLFATVLGTEVEATPGEETEAGDRFLLGDAEVRLIRSDA